MHSEQIFDIVFVWRFYMHGLILFLMFFLAIIAAWIATEATDKKVYIGALSVAIALTLIGIIYWNSPIYQQAEEKRVAYYQQRTDKDNLESEQNHPPKLITKIKDCEIWSFYMNGNDNHYLAICSNRNSSITYPIGKNNTETISTERK